jgi:hypothetical protein
VQRLRLERWEIFGPHANPTVRADVINFEKSTELEQVNLDMFLFPCSSTSAMLREDISVVNVSMSHEQRPLLSRNRYLDSIKLQRSQRAEVDLLQTLMFLARLQIAAAGKATWRLT